MKMQIGLLVLWASTAMAACQSGPYTSGNNVVLSVQCSKTWTGTDYSYPNVRSENSCWDACANDAQCVGVEWDGNFYDCTLFSQVSSTGSGISGQDIAIVQSRPSSTTSTSSIASSTSSSASTTTSGASGACQSGSYTSGNSVVLSVQCAETLSGTSYSTSDSTNSVTEQGCWDVCANDAQCVGALWDNSMSACYLYSQISSTVSGGGATDIAVIQSRPSSTTSSAPSTSSTTSSALTTTSAAAGGCSDGLVISNGAQLLVQCGYAVTTGSAYNSPGSSNEGECWDACANDVNCYGADWDHSMFICELYSSIDRTDTSINHDVVFIYSRPSSTSTSSISSADSTTGSSTSATTSAAPTCQAGIYTSSNNVQLSVTCDVFYTGNSIATSSSLTNIQQCWDFCATNAQCAGATWTGTSCYLFGANTVFAPWNQAGYAGAVVRAPTSSSSSSASSTSSDDSTSSAAPTSSADSTSSAPPTSSTSAAPTCQAGTYDGTINQFTVTCDGSPNAYNTMSGLGSGYTLQTCLQACDADSQCDGATYNERFTYCTTYTGLSTTYSTTGTDFILKIGPIPSSSSSVSLTSTSSVDSTSSSSTELTSSTSLTSTTTSSASSTTSSVAPLTCAQLGGTYTGASNTIFEVTCGGILLGSPSSTTQVDSFEHCMDLCQTDSTCVGVSFFVSMNRCSLAAEYVGDNFAPPYDMAIIPARLPSTSSSSADSTTSTASSTSVSSTSLGSITESLTSTSSGVTSSSVPSSTSTSYTAASSTSTTSTATSSAATSSASSASSTSSGTSSSSATSSSSVILSTTTSLTSTSSTQSMTSSSSTVLPTSSEPISSKSTSQPSQSEPQSTSLSTYSSTSESTMEPGTSTSEGSSLPSSMPSSATTSTTSTSASASPITTSASTETPSSETSTAETTTISFSSTTPEVSFTSTSQSMTSTESTVLSTQQQSLPVTSASPSESATSPTLTTSTTSSTPSSSPRNIPVLDGYDFIACLRSDEGFPTFTEVATQADMTTEICVKLAAGSIYVGVYEQTCYKADSLAGSEIVQDERCSLPCPGDPSLFCGGTTGGAGRRRAIPSNRLLTIYRQAVSSSSFFSSSSSSSSSSSPSSFSPSQSSQALVTQTLSSTSKSNAATTYTLSVSSSSISSRKTTVSSVISELSSISGTPSPITAGPIRTIHVTKGVTVTEIIIAATVTTVTYVTLHPSQPGALTTTCITLTLQYTACGCDHQEYPPVDMTTIISPCQACGYQGQDIVTMVVPVAACETGSVGYGSSGWYDGRQIQPGHGVDVGSQSQPTQGQQNGNGPGYEIGPSNIAAVTQGPGDKAQGKQSANPLPEQAKQNGNGPDFENGPGSENRQSNIAAATQGSRDKEQGKQHANSLPTQGQQNGNEPEYANGPLSTGAATQGSEGKTQNEQTANPLPTQGQKPSGGPNSKNGPLDTEAGAHGSGNEAQNKESPNPLPASGQHNTDRPGDENHQSYVATRPSPEHKNGPGASSPQSINALNPSKPSSGPQDQQPSSAGLTIEASVVPAPHPATHVGPSDTASGYGHSLAISTTFATEVEATKDTEASGSTHSHSPLEPGEASSIPSMVSSSEAHKHQIMSCRMVVVIVGMALLL